LQQFDYNVNIPDVQGTKYKYIRNITVIA